jgi:catechol 2,3-dioxygenase-like lactoylglutathione lyase family enzyme
VRGLLAGLASSLLCLFAAPRTGPPRPPITGLAHVRVLATSVDASRAFYARVLALGPAGGPCAAGRYCLAVNDHQQIELMPAGAVPPRNLLAEVAFATPDAAGMRAYLLAHGVAAGPLVKEPDGTRHFELQDPEGHPLAFVQAPVWKDFRAAGEQVSGRLVHAGFVVKDRATEDRFYRDLLGFRMYWHGGMKDTDTDWVEIQVPDGEDWIEYMLNIDPQAGHDQLGVMNHLALAVKAMKPSVARLRAHGLRSDAQPEIGRDGKWQFDIFDPDATRVEFMEFVPAQAPCCHPYESAHASEPPRP